jgi:hypothetical protein
MKILPDASLIFPTLVSEYNSEQCQSVLEAFTFMLKHQLIVRVSLVMTAFGDGSASTKRLLRS